MLACTLSPLGRARSCFQARVEISDMALKRSGQSSASGAPAKKRGRVDATSLKCSVVAAALRDAEELPQPAREMLGGLIDSSLHIFKEERHPYQVEVVEMVGRALADIEARLERDIRGLQGKSDGALAERGAREEAAATVEASQQALQTAAEEKQSAHNADVKAVSGARDALALAKEEQAAVAAELEKAAAGKRKLEVALSEASKLQTEKVAKDKGGKALVKSLVTLGTRHDFCESLLRGLPTAAHKEPDQRSHFDGLVIQQFLDDLAKQVAVVDAVLGAGDAKKAQCADAVTGAEVACEVAKETMETSGKVAEEAQAKVTTGKAAVKAAQKAIQNWLPDMKEVMDHLDEKRQELEDFRTGALASYAELLELAPAPPTPEPDEPEEPVANDATDGAGAADDEGGAAAETERA